MLTKRNRKQSLDTYEALPFGKPPASSNRKKQLEDERQAMREYGLEHPICEHDGCTRYMHSVHHKQAKKMGGSRSDYIHSKENFISLCIVHHSAEHGIKVFLH